MPQRNAIRQLPSAVHCFVPSCDKNSTSNPLVVFYRLPRDDTALGRRKFKRWLRMIGVTTKPNRQSRVCETHYQLLFPGALNQEVPVLRSSPRVYASRYSRKFLDQQSNPTSLKKKVEKNFQENSNVLDATNSTEEEELKEASSLVDSVVFSVQMETAQRILKEFDQLTNQLALLNMKNRVTHLTEAQNTFKKLNFEEFNYQDWLRNEVELSALAKVNDRIMSSFLKLSQALAETQQELQLLINKFPTLSVDSLDTQMEITRRSLSDVTKRRQACTEEVRECIQLSDKLNFREKKRWNFIRKLSDAQEVLQYLFDELVSFRVSNDEDPVFPVRRETEQIILESDSPTQKRKPLRCEILTASTDDLSDLDPLDLSDLTSPQDPTELHELHGTALRPERFGETDFPYVGDVAHHRSWLTDSGIPPQLRPSGVALSSEQEVEQQQLTKTQGTSVQSVEASGKASCVRLALIGNQVFNLETNRVVANLKSIAGSVDQATGSSRLDSQTLLSIMKYLPGSKKSLRVVAVPTVSIKQVNEPSPTSVPDAALSHVTPLPRPGHPHSLDDHSSYCMPPPSSVNSNSLCASTRDLEGQQPAAHSSIQTWPNEQTRRYQSHQVLNHADTTATAVPCVRLSLIDDKIVNLETNAVIVDLKMVGANHAGRLDSMTLESIMKLLPGAKKSLRVVSVPARSEAHPTFTCRLTNGTGLQP